MFNRIIVPVDGSDESWRAIGIGDRIAVACDADLEIVCVMEAHDDFEVQERLLRRRVGREPLATPRPLVHIVEPHGTSVEATLRDRLRAVNGSLLVMASSGRGRSGAVLGSVATDVVRTTYGPVVMVGPGVDPAGTPAGHDIVVAVDGSPRSEASLGLAGAWSIGFGSRLWVTTMINRAAVSPDDMFESSYVARLAEDLSTRTRREVEFEVLHGANAARAVTDFARRVDAGLIVATTHGRTGLARLALGSTGAAIVRQASCPVVLLRPPTLAEDTAPAASGAHSHDAPRTRIPATPPAG